MIFQKASRFTLGSLVPFLVVHMTIADQQTDSKNRHVVGNCIYSNINTIYVEEMRTNLTPAEFLGSFCIELSVKEIERKCANQGLDITAKVKDCIKRDAKEDLFKKYWNIGTELLDESKQQREELAKKSKQPEAQSSDSQSPRVNSPIKVDNLLENDPQQNPFEEYETGTDVSQSRERFENLSEFSVFSKGLCESPEFVRFPDINDPKDKADTLICSENCISVFFDKIQEALEHLWLKTESAKIVKSGETRVAGLENMPELPDLIKFIPDCLVAKVSTPQQITEVAKSYLQKYNDIYFQLNSEHVLTTDVQMDEILSHAFFDYESCMKWDCSLNSQNDFPLSGWIEKTARNPDIKHRFFRVLLKEAEFQTTPSVGDMLKKQLDLSMEVNASSAQEENDANTNTHKSKVA